MLLRARKPQNIVASASFWPSAAVPQMRTNERREALSVVYRVFLTFRTLSAGRASCFSSSYRSKNSV